MNKLIISGRLTRDAEVRFIPSGTPVMSFSVANNTGFGEKQKTHYFDCSMFGKRAEGKLKDYMLKGQQVVVEGEISLNQYQKKDGTGGASLNVFVNNVELMGSNQKSGGQPSVPESKDDDDLPF
jgi:single-strand DNA-binding protein